MVDLPMTDLLPRLEGALRTLAAPASTSRALESARVDVGKVADIVDDYARVHRAAIALQRQGSIVSGAATLHKVAAGQQDLQYVFAGSIVDAWSGAVLAATDAARALPRGRAGIDVPAVLSTLPEVRTGVPVDAAQAIRGYAAEQLVAPALGKSHTLGRANWTLANGVDAQFEPGFRAQVASLEAARDGGGPAVADVGRSAEATIRAAVRAFGRQGARRAYDGEMMPAAALLAAPAGSHDRLIAVTQRASVALDALQRAQFEISEGALSAADRSLREQLATIRGALREVRRDGPPAAKLVAAYETAPDIGALQQQVTSLSQILRSGDLDAARAALQRGTESPMSKLTDGLHDLSTALNEHRAGGAKEFHVMLAHLAQLNATAATRTSEITDGVERVLQEVLEARQDNGTNLRRYELEQSARAALQRLEPVALIGHAVPEPTRLSIGRLVKQLEDRRWVDGPYGRQPQQSMTLLGRNSGTPEAVADLLSQYWAKVADRVRQVEEISAHSDGLSGRLALGNSLRPGLGFDDVPQSGVAAIADAYERAASHLRARTPAADGADATTDAINTMVDRAGAHLPGGVGWMQRSESAVHHAIVHPTDSSIDRAVADLWGEGAAMATRQRAAYLRTLLADRPVDEPVHEALRGDAIALDGALEQFAGSEHEFLDPDALVKSIASTLLDVERVDGDVRAAVTPHLEHDLLGELGRSLRASEDQHEHGAVWNELLWPDRGTLGSAKVGVRTLADVHEMQSSIPVAI